MCMARVAVAEEEIDGVAARRANVRKAVKAQEEKEKGGTTTGCSSHTKNVQKSWAIRLASRGYFHRQRSAKVETLAPRASRQRAKE